MTSRRGFLAGVIGAIAGTRAAHRVLTRERVAEIFEVPPELLAEVDERYRHVRRHVTGTNAVSHIRQVERNGGTVLLQTSGGGVTKLVVGYDRLEPGDECPRPVVVHRNERGEVVDVTVTQAVL